MLAGEHLEVEMKAHEAYYISAIDMYTFISNAIVATTRIVSGCWQESTQDLAIAGPFSIAMAINGATPAPQSTTNRISIESIISIVATLLIIMTTILTAWWQGRRRDRREDLETNEMR